MKWSDQQNKIFDTITNTDLSICVNANAGAAKTTTIVEASKRIPQNKDAVFIAFNKHIVAELKKRLPENISIYTLHGYGMRVIQKHFPGAKVDENKTFKMALKLFDTFDVTENKFLYCYRVAQITDMMQLTLSLDTPKIEKMCDKRGYLAFDREIEHAKMLYRACHKVIERINFNEMINQVATRDIKVPKYDYVFVDEGQDISEAGHTVIRKMIRPNTGRLIVVGDRRQSIYSFAGASSDSFDRLKTLLPNTIELPLNTSYRCPKKVIEYAQTIVPEIQAWDQAKEGIVIQDEEQVNISMIKENDWVLCRNTLPLVYVFRELIRKNIKANIKGREIGSNLINLIKKTKRETPVEAIKMIQVYLIQLKGKLFRKGFARPETHDQYIALNEKLEITKILSIDVPTVALLNKKIHQIFVDEKLGDGVMLSTIHRAKGLESDRIFILNRRLIPSQYAITEDDRIQETNLMYVAITRSKKELYCLDIDDETIYSALNVKKKSSIDKKQPLKNVKKIVGIE